MEKKWWTLVVVCASVFMLLLDVTIVIVAIPTIQQGLHAGFSDIQWVIDAYALTLASVLLTSGSVADLFGRKLVFISGLAVFTAGSLLCGLATDPLMLILCRALQGVGGSMLFATSLALLAQNFHGRERGVAFGAWGATTGIATGAGPILGGVITSGISWRGIFLVNVPIGLIAIALTAWKVEESKAPGARRPDLGGFAIFTAGLVGLVYGLIRASESGWGDTGTVTSLAAGGVLLLGFVVFERQIREPMLDLSLLRVPTFDGGLISAFCMNGSLFAVFVYIVLYLQDARGYSALQTGLVLLFSTGGTLVAATLAGRLSSQIPVRWLIGPGLFLVGIGQIVMSGLNGSSTWVDLAPGLAIAGIGTGLVNPPLASTAVGVVAPYRSGMASGINTTFRQIGIAVGIAAYGTIFSSSLHASLGHSGSGGGQFGNLVKQGNIHAALNLIPPAARPGVVVHIRAGFAGALNDLLWVSASLALVGAVCAAVLIRPQDFVVSSPEGGVSSTDEPLPAGVE